MNDRHMEVHSDGNATVEGFAMKGRRQSLRDWTCPGVVSSALGCLLSTVLVIGSSVIIGSFSLSIFGSTFLLI